jgi:pectate lyase
MNCRLVFLWMSLWLATTQAADDTRWLSGEGSWHDTSKWSHGDPDALSTAWIRGKSSVRVPESEHTALAGMIRIGVAADEDVRLVIDGGALVSRREFIQIGEAAGSRAEVILEDGALHGVSSVYLGGAGNRNTGGSRAAILIRGGSLVCRLMTLGWGQGAESLLSIEGSKPAAVHLLDYLTLGNTMAGTAPSVSTLRFTLDARGVTPVTIQSRRTGLSLVRAVPGNRCHLEIRLSDVPPRDDVTLVAQQVATKGTFDDMAEGAVISADHADITYSWTLTYRGGKSGCDIVLTGVRGHAADAAVTTCRAVPATPVPLWEKLPVNADDIPENSPLAFAEAEGFGRHAAGGRGGRVIEVTSLADEGPGSLRAALTSKGPRIVQFKVGGKIALRSSVTIREPCLTLDGEGAPAGGITITGGGLVVQTHDVILRHLRIRPGDATVDTDALSFHDARRCIADHLSLSWATDETLSVTGLSDAITVQWCLISESLNREQHAYASVAGGGRTTWHHNLFAHHVSRVPRFAGIVRADFRNNVLYNWGHTAGYGQFERVNYLGNYLKPGPSTTQRPLLVHTGEVVVGNGSFYLEGNVIEGLHEASTSFPPEVMSTEAFPAPPVRTTDAATAYAEVLTNAGATPGSRDATDTRVIQEVRDGTGRVIRHTRELQP